MTSGQANLKLEDSLSTDAPLLDDLSASTLSRITWRLIPVLCLLFIINYVDRTNVAMAKLQMVPGILTDFTYGRGAGLFFIGYFIFEVPSNLILQRVGARRWIARIMITWGIISAAMMFTRGPSSFYSLRLLLGLAEAGFFPGMVLYLTYWVPAKNRAAILGTFLTSIAIAGVIGNPIGGLIMRLDGKAGLHGWQWLFLIEGIPAVIVGVIILATSLLPDRPSQARWLSQSQRDWIETELERDGSHVHVNHIAQLSLAAKDLRLWLLSLIYFLLIMGLYGFVFWCPSIVKSLVGGTEMRVGLLSALPYLSAVIAMVIVGHYADRKGRRRASVSFCAALGTLGILLLTISHGPLSGMIALCLSAVGIFASLGPFWCMPTRYLRGTAAAGGIAIVNSIGCLSGFVAPDAIGWAVGNTGSYTRGLFVIAASLALGSAVVWLMPREVDAHS